jgi:RNA methyltransferase, TrmH family
MERITSRGNPLVRRFRAAAAASEGDLLLDGAHLLEEALASGVPVALVAVEERLAGGPAGDLATRAARQGARVVLVGPDVLAAISPVRQPSGLVALGTRPAVSLRAALSGPRPLVLILSGIQDPGNVGAIVRAADACGATGVVCGDGTADAFGWKALRGSMGSAFHLPVVTRTPAADAVAAARQQGLQVLAAVPRGGIDLPRCDLRGPAAVLLGGEGNGIPGPLLDSADARLSIPMTRQVESLNVATAAALVAYEAMRQRRGDGP